MLVCMSRCGTATATTGAARHPLCHCDKPRRDGRDDDGAPSPSPGQQPGERHHPLPHAGVRSPPAHAAVGESAEQRLRVRLPLPEAARGGPRHSGTQERGHLAHPRGPADVTTATLETRSFFRHWRYVTLFLQLRYCLWVISVWLVFFQLTPYAKTLCNHKSICGILFKMSALEIWFHVTLPILRVNIGATSTSKQMLPQSHSTQVLDSDIGKTSRSLLAEEELQHIHKSLSNSGCYRDLSPWKACSIFHWR